MREQQTCLRTWRFTCTHWRFTCTHWRRAVGSATMAAVGWHRYSSPDKVFKVSGTVPTQWRAAQWEFSESARFKHAHINKHTLTRPAGNGKFNTAYSLVVVFEWRPPLTQSHTLTWTQTDTSVFLTVALIHVCQALKCDEQGVFGLWVCAAAVQMWGTGLSERASHDANAVYSAAG